MRKTIDRKINKFDILDTNTLVNTSTELMSRGYFTSDSYPILMETLHKLNKGKTLPVNNEAAQKFLSNVEDMLYYNDIPYKFVDNGGEEKHRFFKFYRDPRDGKIRYAFGTEKIKHKKLITMGR